VFWQLWSEALLNWVLRKRYWFNELAGLLGSILYFYAIILGLKSLSPGDDLGLDLGPLLLVFVAFNLTVATFQSIAYTIQSEVSQGTLEHLALARGGLLRQLLIRAFVEGLSGLLWAFLTLLPLALLLDVELRPASWWPLGLLPLFLSSLGFALGMGAIALYFKRVEGLFTIVQFLFLPYFFSLVRFDPWKAYLPFAPAVQLLRLSFTGKSLPPDLAAIALVQSFLFLAAGLGAMAWVYVQVRHKGVLGRY